MLTRQIHITGVVQGVGFRPFVYGLALRLGITGWVCNTSAGVDILAQGDAQSLAAFTAALRAEKPPLARIDSLSLADPATAEPHATFEIRQSAVIPGAFQPVSADVATCPACTRELFDPRDRRYLYPFINCTHCGPRFTIIRDLPYDRPATTMADFPLCPACRAEYENPLDRRFHAQPVACPACGPRLTLVTGQAHTADTLAALLGARRLLRTGHILALKGLGGFHLACDARNPAAVQELRRRKGRLGKPFALMASDLQTVAACCQVSPAERDLLTGAEKPILLLQRRPAAVLPDAIAPGVDTLGMMLPYTPLHLLLLDQSDPRLAAEPAPSLLVMTSGNLSEEPIATGNQEALDRLSPLADAFLLHDRDIHIRCDDSVVRTDSRQAPTYLRRSRGYAPYPVRLPMPSAPTLAVGGELKNTFCLTRESYAFLGHHIGDMENAETYASFEQGVAHLSALFRIQPALLACDLHPGYFTTRWAHTAPHGLQPLPVQHHHAHIAACMADNELPNRALIGLAFDGTGYGLDGAIWGGEVLLADYSRFQRAAHLQYLPLPGGDAAVKHPWRIAVGYAHALGLEIDDLPLVRALDPEALRIVRLQVDRRLNCVDTSSMGRLFDAVAVLAGLRGEVTYEAQAAIELETLARAQVASAAPYPFNQADGTLLLGELLQAVVTSARAGEPAGWIGARFHRTLAAWSLQAALELRRQAGLNAVALSGGVWQNHLLLDLTRAALEAAGFQVYCHRQTPANDGGLALGQALVVNHQS